MDNNIKLSRDRFRGCLLGLACGDATGTTLEFKAPGTFKPIEGMVGGGPFGLKAGEWTDDTAMALAMADSLIACQGFRPRDVMDRWLAWREGGVYSCTGRCFDIGCTVSAALSRYVKSGDPLAGINDPMQAGNGCVMRLAPVPMMWATDPDTAGHMAAISCRLTHGADEAVRLTRQFAKVLVYALRGAGKSNLLVAMGDSTREPPQVRGTGYVKDCLEAAAWAFRTTTNFRECILAAANLGDDADTTAAVAGQIAGAFYGERGIPKEWLKRVAWSSRIRSTADRLWSLATGRKEGAA